MHDKPAPHNPTLWVNVRSGLQWLIGGTYFAVTALFFIVASFFVSSYKLDRLLWHMVGGLIFVLRGELRVHGMEKLDPKKAYIFVSNHINSFDHYFIYRALKRPIRGVQKEAHFKWPIYGSFMRRMGIIPIPTSGDTHRAILALARLKKAFEQGASLAVMPEGTRSPDGKLQKFKKGIFYLAVQSAGTIVPMTMIGAYEFNKKGDWRIYPGPIDIYIEDPISTEGTTGADIEPLRDQARKAIELRLQTTNPTRPAAIDVPMRA
jgi:1-acyl-sn-glycerol-3-phosphate acyltransferase